MGAESRWFKSSLPDHLKLKLVKGFKTFRKNKKTGKKWIWGVGTHAQVEALNIRTSVVNRLLGPNTLVNFVTSDFLDVDQIQTSTTINASSGCVSLREKTQPEIIGEASITFNPSIGVAQSISNVYSIYTVTSPNSIPTGIFSIVLNNNSLLNTINFELTAISSNPNIEISVSLDGATYTPVENYCLSGYNLTAHFDTKLIKYILLKITPSIPDNLSGNTYTFGLISVKTYVTEYEYSSVFITKPVSFYPSSASVKFMSSGSSNLNYLSFSNSTNLYEVKSGDTIRVPETTKFLNTAELINGGNYFNPIVLYSNNIIYPKTLNIIDNTTGKKIPLLFGLSPADINLSSLANPYISVIMYSISGVNTYSLLYINNSYTGTPAKTFSISYDSGPQKLNVVLKTILSTTNNTLTPIFSGAVLNEV